MKKMMDEAAVDAVHEEVKKDAEAIKKDKTKCSKRGPKPKVKADGPPDKQEKMFKRGEDFAAYEKRIKTLLKLRTGLIKEVRSVKGDLEALFLDALMVFEDKTDLRVKKIEIDRNASNEAYGVKFEIGF